MSELIASLQSDMQALYESGLVSETTLREFDEATLTPVSPMSADEIKQIRLNNHMSKESVQKWERGEKQPSGAALKLLVLAKEKGLSAIA